MSLAGSELRETIPFNLGKRSNGQPDQSLTGDSTTSDDLEVTNSKMAEKLSAWIVSGDTSGALRSADHFSSIGYSYGNMSMIELPIFCMLLPRLVEVVTTRSPTPLFSMLVVQVVRP